MLAAWSFCRRFDLAYERASLNSTFTLAFLLAGMVSEAERHICTSLASTQLCEGDACGYERSLSLRSPAKLHRMRHVLAVIPDNYTKHAKSHGALQFAATAQAGGWLAHPAGWQCGFIGSSKSLYSLLVI